MSSNPALVPDQRSRFAELAAELLGAKMAAELVREIWAGAGPETRRELADAVLAKIEEQAVSSGAIASTVEQLAQEQARLYVRSLDSRLQADVRASIDRQWPEMVDRAAKDCLHGAIAEVKRRMHFGY